MANYKDHRLERHERRQVVRRQNEQGNRITIEKLEQEIGDKALAFKVSNMSRFDNVDIKTILTRINIIKSIFIDNGSTVENALQFIKNNKIILSIKSAEVLRSTELICAIFDGARKTKKEFIDFIYSQNGNRSILLNNSSSMKKTFDLIIKIFEFKGYSLEQAYNFMADNMHLLNIEYSRLVNILSLLHIVSLEDKLLFEDNKNINFDYNTEYLYDSIKDFSLYNDKITLNKLKKSIREKSELGVAPKHTLSNNLMFCLRSKYELSLNQKREENYKRTL